MNPQEFADDRWQKEDNELFADPTDMLDTSESTPEFNTIPGKTYPYFDELYDSSPLSNIADPLGDKKYDEENDATSENEESHLQLNRRNRDSDIQPLDTTPKRVSKLPYRTYPWHSTISPAKRQNSSISQCNAFNFYFSLYSQILYTHGHSFS